MGPGANPTTFLYTATTRALQREIFLWIFAPTGKVGAYASVGFGSVRA
jgi:hypothetical protein